MRTTMFAVLVGMVFAGPVAAQRPASAAVQVTVQITASATTEPAPQQVQQAEHAARKLSLARPTERNSALINASDAKPAANQLRVSCAEAICGLKRNDHAEQPRPIRVVVPDL